MRVLLVGGFGVGQSLQDLAEGFWHEGHQAAILFPVFARAREKARGAKIARCRYT